MYHFYKDREIYVNRSAYLLSPNFVQGYVSGTIGNMSQAQILSSRTLQIIEKYMSQTVKMQVSKIVTII